MSQTNIYARTIQKHDIEANWKLATNFTPLKGEIIIYDIDDTHEQARIKLGDGETNVNSLPFIDDHKSQVQIIIWEADD